MCINTYQIKNKKHRMKKLITMVALAAISFGSAYAGTIHKMQSDTTKKKSKSDTSKTKPPVMKLKK